MKKLNIAICFLPFMALAQSQNIKKDSAQTIAEVILNTEKKLQVNHLDISSLKAPMSINLMTGKMIEQQNLVRMEDVVQNIPGIHSINQYGGFQFFNIRGFDDFVILNDGVRDERHNITQSAPSTNLANVERVEFLKGPSGDIFGHSALGGILNIVRKKPTEDFRGNANITYGRWNTYNTIFGIGGPISNKLRYRIDAGVNKSDGWRGVPESTNNFSATLQYLPTRNTELELYIQHNNDRFGGDAGVPTDNYGNIIAGIDYKKSFVSPFDYLKNKRTEIQGKFTHRFNDNSKLTNVLSYTNDDIDYVMDEVLFYNPANKTMSLYNGSFHINHQTKPISNQLHYNFNFKTGNINHQMLVGNTTSYLNRKTFNREVIQSATNIEIPVDYYYTMGEKHLGEPWRVLRFNELNIGTYFSDFINFTEKFQGLVSLRYDHFHGKYLPRQAPNLPEKFTYDTFNNITYRLGLTYQPILNFMSIYASTSNFFKPTRSHNHRTNEAFLPQRGYQVEAGAKISKSNQYNINIAGFYIEKNNVLVGHNIISQVGGAASKGFELDADWSPISSLYLKLGYAYTDARFISKGQSDEDQSIIGNRTPWTPLHKINTWVNYEFKNKLKGLGLGIGAFFVDKTYQNQFNTQTLPSYILTNGAVYYQTKNKIRFGLNVENIFNQLYFRSALSSNDLYSNDASFEQYQSVMQGFPGRERNYRLSIGYQF